VKKQTEGIAKKNGTKRKKGTAKSLGTTRKEKKDWGEGPGWGGMPERKRWRLSGGGIKKKDGMREKYRGGEGRTGTNVGANAQEEDDHGIENRGKGAPGHLG